MSPALAPAPASFASAFAAVFSSPATAASASTLAPRSAAAIAAAPAAPASLDPIRYGCGGGVYRIVASAAQTRRTIFAFEAIEPPGGGPPLHVHTREEEFFSVIEGEVTFYIGGQVVRRGPGGSAFVPRGVAHCFKNTSDKPARLLVLFTPGEIEGFFEYGAPLEHGGVPSEQILRDRLEALAPRFGIEVLGPSPL